MTLRRFLLVLLLALLIAVVFCLVARPRTASYGGETTAPLDVVVNEIAWTGTTVSSSDEWIELYNHTGVAVDLTGSLPADGHSLLKRTDDRMTAEPTVNFSSPTYTVGEWHSSATITVTLDTTSTLPVTVDYSAAENTAGAGVDFTAVSDTLTFAPGLTLTTFTVPILDDTLLEPSETISLTLSWPTNATLGPLYAATLAVLDDDAQSQVFLPVVMNGPPTTMTGVYSIVGNPCTTDP